MPRTTRPMSTPRRVRSLHRASLLGAIALISLLSGLLATTPAEADSSVKFMRDARSDFDPYLTSDDDATRDWIRENYWRMRGYAPFFSNNAIEWAPPTHVYRDAYAIYNDRKNYPNRPDLKTLEQHPDWALRDAAGKPLYIQFGCSNGSCPQFAADIGNPEFRRYWIEQAAEVLDDGYKGLYIDDVNMEWRISNGSGQSTTPIDPRTGQPMTIEAWRLYMAKFMAEVAAAFPSVEITHNNLWFAPRDEDSIRREIDSADFVNLERGFNDAGIVGGTGKFGYETLLAQIESIHASGASAILMPYGLDRQSAEFELANYFLIKTGRDALMSDYRANPSDFWNGWQTDLGRPKGHWRIWRGLFRRNYQGGMVLVNQPDAATASVRVPANLHDLDGNSVRKLTLSARSAKVLIRD